MADEQKVEIQLSAEDERNSLPLADELSLVEESLKLDNKTEDDKDNKDDTIDNEKIDITPEFSNADDNDNPDADTDLDNSEGDSSDSDSSVNNDSDSGDTADNSSDNKTDNKKKKNKT